MQIYPEGAWYAAFLFPKEEESSSSFVKAALHILTFYSWNIVCYSSTVICWEFEKSIKR